MKHVVKLASPMWSLGYFERMVDGLNFGQMVLNIMTKSTSKILSIKI